MKTFPTLFKKSKAGKVSEWNISVLKESNGSVCISVTYGYIDGKKQTTDKSIECGKNIGKANETTPLDQAISEAESQWKKQLDKGYVEDLDDVNSIVYLPMLAHPFEKKEKHLSYPCYAQPKFDGVRSLCTIKGDDIVFTSRKGKVFFNHQHLHKDVRNLLNALDNVLYLDGELYSDVISFQRLVGLVKKEKITEEDIEDIKYIDFRVYDCILKPNVSGSYFARYGLLMDAFRLCTPTKVFFTHSEIVENREQVQTYHDKYVQEGYEGLILRNFRGNYEINKRSNTLLKYKDFIDCEFEIVGFEEGAGRAKGTVIWKCKTDDGKVFSVRPRGTERERRDWFDNGNQFIGQPLTVRFQEYSEDGIPRFPVGVAIRSYE
jgi:DNA ligase-1